MKLKSESRPRKLVRAALVVIAVSLSTWSLSAAPASAITWLAKQCVGFAGCNAVGKGNAGYQNEYTASHWGMYGGHNCTNYAAYRLIKAGVPNLNFPGGQGNATNWSNIAGQRGYPTDKNPRPGDIAWFSGSTPGLGAEGHVAYVESVEGNRVIVSEDSWGGDFDWRPYYISEVSGFIHFGAAPNQTPFGHFDSASGGAGTVTVAGWAADRDAPSTPISVHAYVGGPSGSGEGHNLGAAQVYRPDVAAAYPGLSNNHGFEITFSTSRRGQQTVYLYAINTPQGDNPLIGQKQVTISDPPAAFSVAPAPTIAGTARVGSRLSASVGSWAPTPDTLTYRWLRDASVAIGGATGSSYTLTAADRGHTIAVRVTAAKSGYAATARTSKPTSVVVAGTITTSKPWISGTRKVGKTLYARTGTWKPSGLTFSYQWYRNGKAISHATKSSYKLTKSDKGKRMSVRVKATKAGYTTASRASSRTGAVR